MKRYTNIFTFVKIKEFKVMTVTCALLLCAALIAPLAMASMTSYTYNDRGQIETIDGPRTDKDDITTYSYNTNGTRKSTINALGHVYQLQERNGLGLPERIIDPNGVVSILTYHPRGWLTTYTVVSPIESTADDSVTKYSYGASGLLNKVVLPNQVTLHYQYDAAQRLEKIWNDAGAEINYTLDDAGNPTRTDVRGENGDLTFTARQTFDELSRVMDFIGSEGETTHIDYDTNSNPDIKTNPKNFRFDEDYDPLNRLERITDPNNGITEFIYDSQNRITNVIDANNKTTTYEYDYLDNVIKVISQTTGVTDYVYDEASNLTRRTDAAGNVIEFEYDSLNRIEQMTYPSSSAENTLYEYDATLWCPDVGIVQHCTNEKNYGVGRLTSAKNINSTTYYRYNYLGNLVEKVNILSDIATIERPKLENSEIVEIQGSDDNNFNISDIAPEGISLKLNFSKGKWDLDVWDLLYIQLGMKGSSTSPSVIYVLGTAGMNGITFTEFIQGNITGQIPLSTLRTLASGEYAVEAFAWTMAGSKFSLGESASFSINGTTEDSANNVKVIDYEYNHNGSLSGITYPSGMIIQYIRNDQGKVESINYQRPSEIQLNLVNNIEYLPFGPVSRLSFGNGLTTNNTFDQSYRVIAKTTGTILDLYYMYDENSNIEEIENLQFDTNSNIIKDLQAQGEEVTDKQIYSYDPMDRVITVDNNRGNVEFDYDLIGNRSTRLYHGIVSESSSQGMQEYSQYRYDSGGQLFKIETNSDGLLSEVNFSYDLVGSIKAGLLTESMNDQDAKQALLNLTYSYNASNRLIKVVGNNFSAHYKYNTQGQRNVKTIIRDNQETMTVYYYNEQGQLLAETSPDGSNSKEYIYLNNKPIGLITDSETYFYHNDHLGTPRVITDSLQEKVWTADYSVFGRANITTAQITNNLRFAGQYFDSETKLHYNWFRYYDPSLGRYLRSDPIGLAGGINTYAYAKGNPLSYVDPDGKMSIIGRALGGAFNLCVKNKLGCTAVGGGVAGYNVDQKLEKQKQCELQCKKSHSKCTDEGNTNPLTACKAQCVQEVWAGKPKKAPWVKRM